jgi:hypothetical protein
MAFLPVFKILYLTINDLLKKNKIYFNVIKKYVYSHCF